jgi:hypothetical protein
LPTLHTRPARPPSSTPPCTIWTRLPTLGRCSVDSACYQPLASNFSPTRSLLPRRRAVRRSCLPPIQPSYQKLQGPAGPACSTASVDTSPAIHYCHRASCKPRSSLCPVPRLRPGRTQYHQGRHVRRRTREAELDQVLILSLLTLHFSSGKALSPLRALATKSPPVNARLLGGPFHWEI